MKYIFVLSILLSCLGHAQSTQLKEVNVLFIGNSLTYFHGMPETLQKMLNETDAHVRIEQSTFPGMSLSDHLEKMITSRTENGIEVRKKSANEETETELKIRSRKWDFIVMQTGGISVMIPESRDLKIDSAIAQIIKVANNPQCRFVLFTTWPSVETYPEKFCYPSKSISETIQTPMSCSEQIESVEQYQKILSENYQLLARRNKLIESANGRIFYKVMSEHKDLAILEDESHPSEIGAFLNACVFYKLLTGKNAENLKFNGALEPKLALKLKQLSN